MTLFTPISRSAENIEVETNRRQITREELPTSKLKNYVHNVQRSVHYNGK
jgi:hypothetical protein